MAVDTYKHTKINVDKEKFTLLIVFNQYISSNQQVKT